MTSKAERLAAAAGGPMVGKVGAVTLSAGSFAEQDVTAGGVLPFGAYDLVSDIDVVILQGAAGLAAPVIATVGPPGTANVGWLLPAKTPKRIIVSSTADAFIRGTAGAGGILRWYCANQNQPPT